MKCAVLFSGGKDSAFAGYLAREAGLELGCLVSIISENDQSYMFHTPSIGRVTTHAEVMDLPLILEKTAGIEEIELDDLKRAICRARDEYGCGCVISGAVESAYQASRIQRICEEVGLICCNPLWQRDQVQLLQDLIESEFTVIITGVFAYPLDGSWLGRRIDGRFIEETKVLKQRFGINPAGEGGEFESFVLDCPLFKRPLKVIDKKIKGHLNSWSMEVVVE